MKLLIGIPAYNESKMIGEVIRAIPKYIDKVGRPSVVVVDDGSLDSTGREAEKVGVLVITHVINRGLGGAIKTIFRYAKKYNYDILVTLDSDGQHDPSEISKLARPILDKKADVVIGTRWQNNSHFPLSRMLINFMANIITFLTYGIWSTDSQSGMRAFGKKAIKKIRLQTDGMEVSSEIFREIFIHKLHFIEKPIHVIYTEYSMSKGQRLSNAPNVFFQLLFRLLR
jgi:glycosyltransferase involved in cell wall biosynthesis